MKKISIFLLLTFGLAQAQEKIITRTGKITFEASVPSFEEVKATNENVSCIINTKTGEIAALALQKGFRFKIALMEEHYNENYVESDKYPKATFKGVIEKFNLADLNKNAKDFTITGKLELHGKSKDFSIPAKIKKTEKGVEIVCNFSVNADDFNIQIPGVVSKKVSKKVNLSLDFTLK